MESCSLLNSWRNTFANTLLLYKCQMRNKVRSRTISYLLLSAVPLFQRPVISVTHTRGGRCGSAAAAAAAAARAVLLRVARHPVRGDHDDDGMSGVCAVQPLREPRDRSTSWFCFLKRRNIPTSAPFPVLRRGLLQTQRDCQ